VLGDSAPTISRLSRGRQLEIFRRSLSGVSVHEAPISEWTSLVAQRGCVRKTSFRASAAVGCPGIVMQAANRPLQEVIRPTKELLGVSGTFNLEGRFGTSGSRRLVCLTDGSAIEEVLHSEVNPDNRRFRYVVWNDTNRKFRTVDYAVGEFIYTQPASDKTHVNWPYRFALKSGLGTIDESRFRKSFLDREFADWMRSVLEFKRSTAEAAS
jgi:hypothetical protein